MSTSEIETVEQVWPSIAPLLFVPHTEHEYDQLVAMLDTLIDVVVEIIRFWLGVNRPPPSA